MPSPRRYLQVASLVLLASLAGCTISFHPWGKHVAAPAAAPPAAVVPGTPIPGAVPAPVDPAGISPYPPGILPTSSPQRPLAPNPNESVVQLIRQLNEADDNRRVMQDQVQSLRKQLREREENLRLASYEMEESSKQLRRTRDDFRQWQTEMEEMRDRIRKLEEGRAALRPLIEDIQRQLESALASHKTHAPPQPLR